METTDFQRAGHAHLHGAHTVKTLSRHYLGIAGFGSIRELFTSATEPTEASHPRYVACIGPFTTRRGAEFMLRHGQNNPHCQTVADAELLAAPATKPRRYTSPEPPGGETMRRLMLTAIDAHPQGEDYRAQVALLDGRAMPGYTRWRFDNGPVQLRLHVGRTMYRVLDNPVSLAAHALAVARCPGWTGKRTPRTTLRDGSPVVMYTHADGWALAIPEHQHGANFGGHTEKYSHPVLPVAKLKRLRPEHRHKQCEIHHPWWPLQIGHVTLRMHPDLTIEGAVPRSWLIDLNEGPIVDEGAIETQLELAA